MAGNLSLWAFGGNDRLRTMSDEATPFVVGDERTTLLSFLTYLRHAVARKAAGVDDAVARFPAVPSGTTLGGVVKHLTNVERMWVQYLWAGLDDVHLDREHWTPSEAEGLDALLVGYSETWARNDELVWAAADLDVVCARTWRGHRLTLRWTLVHLLEETARHAGHADILRELLDGTVGR